MDVRSYLDGKMYSTLSASIEYARLWFLGDFASLRIGVYVTGTCGADRSHIVQFAGFQMGEMLSSQGYDYHPCLANVMSSQMNEYAYVPGNISFVKEGTPFAGTGAMSGSAFFSPYGATNMSGNRNAAVRAEFSSLSTVNDFSAIMGFDIPVQKIQ